jgi:hypothetical protein
MCTGCKDREPRDYTPKVYPQVEESVMLDYLIRQHASGSTDPMSLKVNALLIREYGETAKAIILELRKNYRQRTADNQLKWRISVSRRPQRGKHYDSWSTREQYCRSTNGSPITYAQGAWR